MRSSAALPAGALALGLLLLTPLARADVAPRGPYRPPTRMRLRLTTVRVESGDAPREDQQRAEREVRSALHRAQGRLDTCLQNHVLRDDALRSRRRTLEGRLAFDRSARPTGQGIIAAQGIPQPARACVAEVTRGLGLSSAPRGFVELRYRYTLIAVRGR